MFRDGCHVKIVTLYVFSFRALEEMDSSIFQGRLLHVMLAKQRGPSHLKEYAFKDIKFH